MHYIMECGHANNGWIYLPDGTSKPMCMVCSCDKTKKEITSDTEGLENRIAHCMGHKGKGTAPIASRWDLPFFRYTPEHDYDEYYCGCWGWD